MFTGGHPMVGGWAPVVRPVVGRGGVGSLQEMGFAGMGGLGSVRKMSGHFLSTHRNTEKTNTNKSDKM